ncbi:MAG: FAD-binding oxidoreductase [Polyangiaceae bacterium]|nr:FAD-binding oxidoreductase [Polyangiaceae bacterium]
MVPGAQVTSDALARAVRDAAPGVVARSSELDRLSYARDLWPRHHLGVRDGALPASRPALVVWPRTTEEVAAIVRRCADEGAPIAPFGAGSGVCGGTLPDPRTVIVDLKKLARVRRLDERGVIDVEAGAMGIRLEEDLDARGHTLGHFPSSILCSTVGGWIAARSAGQCSGLYGKIEDMVVSLECVVGRGEIVRLRRRLHGPDATPLVVGSEGIFGIVTAAELRLHSRPTARGFAAFSFPSVVHGWEAMRELFQAGLRPAVARLYDAFDSFMAKRGAVRGRGGPKKAKSSLSVAVRDAAMRALLRHPSVMNSVVDRVGDRAFGGAMLVLVFEGDGSANAADLDKARHVCLRNGATSMGEGPAQHWFKHRYAVSYRQAPVFMSGSFSDTMEVATTWSRLGELYENVRRALSPYVFVMAHLSHAYPDGCSIYFTFAGSGPTRQAAETVYDAAWSAALEAAIASGGTLSHHHGVGRSKAPKLGHEIGLGVQVVRALGGVLDPSGIFNPGNLLPSELPARPLRSADLPPPRAPRFDDASLLVHANGDTQLGAIEDMAHARGYTLGFDGVDPTTTVATYLASGALGSPDAYADPADHLVAGFTARLASGDELVVRPGPRRAVGPDLYALFHGCGGAVGGVTSAHLRLHRLGMHARALPSAIDRDPSPAADERELLERLHVAARGARWS